MSYTESSSSGHRQQAEAVESISPLSNASSRAAGSNGSEQPPSLLAYPATYLLLAINIVVFAIMFVAPAAQLIHQHQASLLFTSEFSTETVLQFGGSSSVLVQVYHEWWRLVTACFVHVTLLHLAINMWCLWNLGLFGEPLLGKAGLIAVYLLTGAAGMLLSLIWSIFTRQPGIVAGASGAVFGIAGILIVLLSNRKLSLPWSELRSLRQSVILFAVLNLAIGLLPRMMPAFTMGVAKPLHISPESLPRVDNSAHLGGFLYGLALGFPLFPRMTSGRSSYRHRQGLVFTLAGLLIGLCCYAVAAFAGGSSTSR